MSFFCIDVTFWSDVLNPRYTGIDFSSVKGACLKCEWLSECFSLLFPVPDRRLGFKLIKSRRYVSTLINKLNFFVNKHILVAEYT